MTSLSNCTLTGDRLPVDAVEDLKWKYNEAASLLGLASSIGPQLDRLAAGLVGTTFTRGEADDDRVLLASKKLTNVNEVLQRTPRVHVRVLDRIYSAKKCRDRAITSVLGEELVALAPYTPVAKSAYKLMTGEAYARPECVRPWLEKLITGPSKKKHAPLFTRIKIESAQMRHSAHAAYEEARAAITEENRGRRKLYPSNRRRENRVA